MTPHPNKHLSPNMKQKAKKSTSSRLSSREDATTAPNINSISHYGYNEYRDDLGHLAFTYTHTHTEDSTHTTHYDNTAYPQAGNQDNNPNVDQEHDGDDIDLNQERPLFPQYTYNQTTHLSSPYTPYPSPHTPPSQAQSQTPFQRWEYETPLQSPWDAIQSYRPFVASPRQGQGQEQGQGGGGEQGSGRELKGEDNEDGYGDDRWSLTGTWGSGDGNVAGGVRMMRS